MRYLYLLRHAKSSWDDPDLADRDRPLAKRGRRDATRMAAHIRSMDIRMDLVLCSSSVRTTKTLRPLLKARGLDDARCLIEDELYGADEGTLLDRVRRVPNDVDSVMVIGHNPGLQDLARLLCGEEGGEIPRRIEEKFPTSALAILRIRGDWASLGHGDAEPTDFVLARDLH